MSVTESYTLPAKTCNRTSEESGKDSFDRWASVEILISKELLTELDAADASSPVRDTVYWAVHQCQTTRAQYAGINQKLIETAYSSQVRRELVSFLKSSKEITPAQCGFYAVGRQCKRYELKRQHYYGTGCDVDVDESEMVWITVDLREMMKRRFDGCVRLGWDRSRVQAEWSASKIDAPEISIEDARDLAPAEVADAHVRAFLRYVQSKTVMAHRENGRMYSTITSLPRQIRKQAIRFDGKAEAFDISACYVWILSAENRLRSLRKGENVRDVDRLMDLIESGKFYSLIAESAGCSTAQAKADFQTFCLFGPIGWHPLWQALESICPSLCRDIRWWHSQRGGHTRLAFFLQRCEGHLMLDGVIDWLVSQGVPCVGIHDGAIVPEGVASVAAEYLRKRSKDIYGRACAVKVEVI